VHCPGRCWSGRYGGEKAGDVDLCTVQRSGREPCELATWGPALGIAPERPSNQAAGSLNNRFVRWT